MNQATLDVVIQVQKIAQATKDIRGLDSDLKQAAQSADRAAKDIATAGPNAGQGFAKAGQGIQAVGGDLRRVAGDATATASKMSTAGTQGGKGFATGAAAVKTAGGDLVRVAMDANATASKMSTAGMEAGRGFSTGAGRGLAGTAGDLSKVSTDARSTAGQMGVAGSQGGQGFAQGVRVAVQRVQGAFGSAVTAAKGAASDFGTAGRQAGQEFANKAESGIDGLKGKLKAGAALAGAAAGGALAAGLASAVSLDAANDKLAAQLGLTGKRAKMAGKVAGDLYAGAYGGSMEEVNTAVGAVMSSIEGMSGASGGRLKAVTARALDFASAFDIDVQKGVYHAGLAMEQGLAPNAKRAFDLIVAMSQSVPAELREDALEAQEEYGGFLASIGFSGKEAFGLLAGAAQEGRYALDKTGDALKEFTILGTNMSTASKAAYTAAGLDAQTMAERILKGGKSAKGAMRDTVDGLLGIKNPAKQANAAIALFGAPLEDLGTAKIPAFLRVLKGTGGALDNVTDASDRLGVTLNDNEKTRLTAFKRAIEVGIQRAILAAIPVLSKLGGAVKAVAGPIADVVGWFKDHKAATVALTAVLAPLVALWVITKTVAIASRIAYIALGVAIGIVRGAIIALTIAQRAAAIAALLFNAALLANPIGLIIIAIIALAAGLVLLWKKSETFRDIVIGVWNAIKTATVAVWEWIKTAATTYFGAYKAIVGGVWGAIKAVTSAVWGAIKGVLGAVWGAIKGALSTVFGVYKTIVTGAWGAIKTATSAVWNTIKGVLSTVWGAIKGAASTAWQGVKTVIVNPVRSVFEWVRTAVGNVREWLANAWATIRERTSVAWQKVKGAISGPISSVFEWVRNAAGNVAGKLAEVWGNIKSRAAEAWGSIKSTIVDAFNGALRGVGRIVNAIIGVLNKIPGVNIGKVEWGGLAEGGSLSRAGVDHAQALAHGGKVTRPTAIVGEEGASHPEWVIPSNPAYRSRALGLYAQLGSELGVPGYAVGGVLGDIGKAVTAPARAGLGLLGKGAGWFIDQLPNPADMLPSWLRGLGSEVIDWITGWITEQVSNLTRIALADNGPGKGGRKPPGFATGGVIGLAGVPYVGSYRTGGTLPADGMYMGHRGETVTPKGAPVREGPLVVQNIENYNVLDDHDEERNANVVAHKLRATGVI